MDFRTKLDFSNNRQVKQYVETITNLSGATHFGVPFSALTSGPNLTTTGLTQNYTTFASTFSGNSATTVFNWYYPEMSLGENTLSAITPSNTGTTQVVGPVFTASTTTVIDGNTVALSYSGVNYNIIPISIYDLGGGAYSGTVQSQYLNLYSANTLDFTGRTIWVDVSGITRTQDLIITDNPNVGYVWTCIDSEGRGAWSYNASALTTTYWSAGSGTNAVVLKNSAGAATNTLSLVEGYGNTASGAYSHAEGYTTIASGIRSHSEGFETTANGQNSHAEGSSTTASGAHSHAEGVYTIASGISSHAEGSVTTASATASHAEGGGTKASGNYSHAEGQNTIASGETSHAEGLYTTASGIASHAQGTGTTASGLGSHAEGSYSLANSDSSHAEGYNTKAIATYSHAEGIYTTASGSYSHAEGGLTKASGIGSHAEGSTTTASGDYSHAEGSYTTATGNSAHAEGVYTYAFGVYSHSEGQDTYAIGYASHAEGNNSSATGSTSHAEGSATKAWGDSSHSEGGSTTAKGNYSHAGGWQSVANGTYSFVHGSGSTASSTGTIVLGSGIVGLSANTTYVDSLNIKTVGAGPGTTDIGIDANGFVVNQVSDLRLKENITPLTNALDKVKNLRGVSYQWKDKAAGGDSFKIGFIAQEVYEVEPLLTFVNDKTKEQYMGVHYKDVTALLVEAVKELASGTTNSNNAYLETQTILAEDNNIDLNFNGTPETAFEGGIRVLHARGVDLSSEFLTDINGDWVTNNDLKPKALTIPVFTPTSSTDASGNIGNITRDENYIYVKCNNGWKRSSLESF